MLIFNYGHKVYFSPRLFWIFKKWTKKMSKIENLKILLENKKLLKYNKFPKLLKGFYKKRTKLVLVNSNHLGYFLYDFGVLLIIIIAFSSHGFND